MYWCHWCRDGAKSLGRMARWYLSASKQRPLNPPLESSCWKRHPAACRSPLLMPSHQFEVASCCRAKSYCLPHALLMYSLLGWYYQPCQCTLSHFLCPCRYPCLRFVPVAVPAAVPASTSPMAVPGGVPVIAAGWAQAPLQVTKGTASGPSYLASCSVQTQLCRVMKGGWYVAGGMCSHMPVISRALKIKWIRQLAARRRHTLFAPYACRTAAVTGCVQ